MWESAIILGGLGVVSAVGLGIAARLFAVPSDPRVQPVEEALPGANCGGCGFAGCAACARAIVRGQAPVNACVVGGAATARAVGALLGLEAAAREPEISAIGCWYGMDAAPRRFTYDGVADCHAAMLLAGGGKVCEIGCLGFGDCVRACQFGALALGGDGLPHVNAGRCTGCGACVRICPKGIVTLTNPTERILHQPHEGECLAPCESTCPANIDIPAYIEAIGRGAHHEAVRIIKESNPLPLVCGRVCPHPCERRCRRGPVDQPVAINHLKRFAADFELALGAPVLPTRLPDTGHRVAIIGAGPAGLSAAYYLARLGHRPTIFEAMPEPGGMLRYGIPEYRLPRATLEFEIRGILELGVELRCDQRLGRDFSIRSLRDDGFQAILLATGAWQSRRLEIPGEGELAGASSGLDFLVGIRKGERPRLDGRVIICGGGNTAMDAARTALRLGAPDVQLLYRRSRQEMPAAPLEVAAAEAEGVAYSFLCMPRRLTGEGGHLAGIEVQSMTLGEPDASGRRRPVPAPGTERIEPAGTLFSAVGQIPDLSWLADDEVGRQLGETRWGTVEADEATLATAVPGVFAGGDLRRGAATAIEAIADGRRAARSIHQHLAGLPVAPPEGFLAKPLELPGTDPADVIAPQPRAEMPELPADERRGSFAEVELGLVEAEARREAARCLQCGLVCYTHEGNRRPA